MPPLNARAMPVKKMEQKVEDCRLLYMAPSARLFAALSLAP
jgi:hypothetical protein